MENLELTLRVLCNYFRGEKSRYPELIGDKLMCLPLDALLFRVISGREVSCFILLILDAYLYLLMGELIVRPTSLGGVYSA